MQETNFLDIGRGRIIRIPVNYQHFYLNYSSNPEDFGWEREEVIHILECVKEGRLYELDMNDNLMNDIGTFFEDGICVKPDINAAVFWYEQALNGVTTWHGAIWLTFSTRVLRAILKTSVAPLNCTRNVACHTLTTALASSMSMDGACVRTLKPPKHTIAWHIVKGTDLPIRN